MAHLLAAGRGWAIAGRRNLLFLLPQLIVATPADLLAEEVGQADGAMTGQVVHEFGLEAVENGVAIGVFFEKRGEVRQHLPAELFLDGGAGMKLRVRRQVGRS